jgi:glycosyltransferase involved in cell wall biosynthesis
MSLAAPAVSVVVPCRNEAGHIETCLRSILAQRPPEGGFEVNVADGMSNDGTRKVLDRLAKEDERIRIVDNPGRIVSTGLNTAIKASRGRVIVRMDAHTEYAPDYIQQCLSVLRETGADNVGGPWIAKGQGYASRAIAAAFQSPFAAGGARSHDPGHVGKVDSVYLGCWPREVFDRVGLFDEELVRNQDDEFNLRLTRAGGKIWQSPSVKSWYVPRDSLKSLFRQYVQYGYWKVRVIQKHKLPASLRHLVPALFVATLALLGSASTAAPAARIGLAVVLSFYVSGLSLASLVASRRAGWDLLPLLPIVFACFHIGYGMGFLYGLLDFLVLRRGPRSRFQALTRAPSGASPRRTTIGDKHG